MNIPALKAELTADPLSRGYAAMSDQAAADSLNLANRDGNAEPGALFNYLARNQAKDGSTEPATTHIVGRLRRVVEEGVIGQKTFDSGASGTELTGEGKDACTTLLQIVAADRLGSYTESLVADEFKTLLQDVVQSGVMKPVDRTAIIALSQNRQTRASEIKLGKVKLGHVQMARA